MSISAHMSRQLTTTLMAAVNCVIIFSDECRVVVVTKQYNNLLFPHNVTAAVYYFTVSDIILHILCIKV